MTATQEYSFDLAEEMVQQLEQEFGPDALQGEMKKAFDGAPSEADAQSFFSDYGRRWMERTIEVGEEHPDRTYEVLKEAAERIDELRFPFLAQRYIEIAYLSTQPIYTLPISENGAHGMVFKMPFCGYYKAVQESQGEEFAKQLHCKSACVAACHKAFSHFGSEVNVGMDATMPVDEHCQFSIRKA